MPSAASYCVPALGFLLVAAALWADDSGLVSSDEQLLRSKGVRIDGPGLLAFIQSRTLKDQEKAPIDMLIRQLGDNSFQVREEALAKLIERGPAVVPQLKEALQSDDPEVVNRAVEGLKQINRRNSPEAVAAAVRLLTARRPAGTVEALLDFAPFPNDEYVLDEIRAGLRKLAIGAEKSLLAATKDKAPIRRALAAEALILTGDDVRRRELRPLLQDNDRSVRLRVAHAYSQRAEKIGVPVLISLIDRDDAAAQQAETYLFELAGKNPPDATTDGAAIEKRQESWHRWWEKNQDRKDLFRAAGALMVERFIVTAADIKHGYRGFVYETTLPGCKAEAKDRRLWLRGDHAEADQRLTLVARKALGKAEWPCPLEVSAKLGGTARDNIAWHVGVSIGRVKVLFHPNFQGGAFRAEDVNSHMFFFNNEDLDFTPAADIAHKMTIRVLQTADGYRFEATLEEGGPGKGKHRRSFEVGRERVGPLAAIGLDRSGRQGGDAFFELLSIKTGGE